MSIYLHEAKLKRCPFDRSHKISEARYKFHVAKCASANRALYVQCKYNAGHWILPEEAQEHLRSCGDFLFAAQEVKAKFYSAAAAAAPGDFSVRGLGCPNGGGGGGGVASPYGGGGGGGPRDLSPLTPSRPLQPELDYTSTPNGPSVVFTPPRNEPSPVERPYDRCPFPNNRNTFPNDPNSFPNDWNTSLNDRNTSQNNRNTFLSDPNSFSNDRNTSQNDRNTSQNDRNTSQNDRNTSQNNRNAFLNDQNTFPNDPNTFPNDSNTFPNGLFPSDRNTFQNDENRSPNYRIDGFPNGGGWDSWTESPINRRTNPNEPVTAQSEPPFSPGSTCSSSSSDGGMRYNDQNGRPKVLNMIIPGFNLLKPVDWSRLRCRDTFEPLTKFQLQTLKTGDRKKYHQLLMDWHKWKNSGPAGGGGYGASMEDGF